MRVQTLSSQDCPSGNRKSLPTARTVDTSIGGSYLPNCWSASVSSLASGEAEAELVAEGDEVGDGDCPFSGLALLFRTCR
ncbi:hypothetical protein [Paenibacillus agaridevorans]|uniref:hypothetical protein n=1 Tax=Paenibacillus agaridevorans TaxID=171404 RepID=UPI001BE43E33|nr:hypothetical protein [Paenibacillus agaridevorans]